MVIVQQNMCDTWYLKLQPAGNWQYFQKPPQTNQNLLHTISKTNTGDLVHVAVVQKKHYLSKCLWKALFEGVVLNVTEGFSE